MWRTTVLLGPLALALTGAAPATAPHVTDLKPLVLHPGVNRVPGFLPGGGAATIVQAWRGNGNAHGHTIWMVLAGPSEDNPVGLVGVDGEKVDETISDNPFDGERVLGVVRFATGRVDGKPISLLIRADLNASASGVLADHATARVRWYRLDHDADAIGRPTDTFEPIGEARTTKRYCNAELALRDMAGVALAPGYAGPNRTDGCFAG